MKTKTDQFQPGTDSGTPLRAHGDARRRHSRRWAFAFGGLTIATTVAAALAIALPDQNDEAAETIDAGPTVTQPTVTQPAATVPTLVNRWPDTSRNAAGVYSWDGTRDSPLDGFMHNGYASEGAGDVVIRISATSTDVPIVSNDDGATVVTVAGHDALYRRADNGGERVPGTGLVQRETRIADIEGTTVVINLDTRPGTSEAALSEAHAIIESMRTEPMNNPLGFRLLFTLTTDDWDSG